MPTEHIKYEDTLRQGTDKINDAIDQANKAEEDSAEALDTANQALQNSESTQTQLDTIVIEGDSSVEAAQARVNADGSVTYTTLKERLDTEHTEVTAQLAENAKKINKTVSVLLYNSVQDAIDYATTIQTNYDLYNGTFSSGLIEIDFGGKEIEVDSDVVIPPCAGIIFKNGILKASDNFVGEFVIKTDPNASSLSYHYITFRDFHINGNFKASGLLFDKYNRCFINNLTITGWTDYGLKVGDSPSGPGAHELIVNGLFIGQYEWFDPNRDTSHTTPSITGTALVVNTHDNHFSNFIIFSGLKGVEVNKEFNIFNNFHIWGNGGRENGFRINDTSPITINQGYFDGCTLNIVNPWQLTITNTMFLSDFNSGETEKPSAYIIFETSGGTSKYLQKLTITGNTFKNVGDKPMEMIELRENDGSFALNMTKHCTIIGNTGVGDVSLTYSEYTKTAPYASGVTSFPIDFSKELKLGNPLRIYSHSWNDDTGKSPITDVTTDGHIASINLYSDTNKTKLTSNGSGYITASINRHD